MDEAELDLLFQRLTAVWIIMKEQGFILSVAFVSFE